MVSLNRHGRYKLIETRRNTKMLYLDKTAYAWVEPWSTKQILVISRRPYITDCLLSVGEYCLYDLDDEPHLPGKQFLELEVGDDVWQGYLLLTGLPDNIHKRVRIIPTHEIVTNNPAYSDDGTHVSRDNGREKGKIHEVSGSL